MPRKGGRATSAEMVFSAAMANTGDQQYAAAVAKFKPGSGAAHKALQRPAVIAEITRIQTERLFNELLPLAVGRLAHILESDKAPAGAQVQAAKLVFDRTLGVNSDGTPKDPHEMNGVELAKAIEELKQRAAERAKPIIDMEPVPDIDIFK